MSGRRAQGWDPGGTRSGPDFAPSVCCKTIDETVVTSIVHK